MKKLTISETITIVDIEGTIDNIVDWLNTIQDNNREKYTKIRLSMDYDHNYNCDILVVGDRLETDEEFEKRTKAEEQRKKVDKYCKEKQDERDRKLYDKLKKKFEKH